MSRNKKFNKHYQNNLMELAAITKAFNQQGSSLSSYDTISNSNNYALITINWILLTYLYSGNGLFNRAVRVPVMDGFSKGVEILSDEASHEDIKDVNDWMKKKKVIRKLVNAATWGRLYGGSGLVINTDQNPEEPLDLESLNKDSEIDFYDADRWSLTTTDSAQKNIEDVFISAAESEYFYIYGQKIHKSRVLPMMGERAPTKIRRLLRGWGLSCAEKMIRDLNNYIKTDNVLYEILDESKLDIYYIKDLSSKLVSPGGVAKIRDRVQAANELKNYLNALLLDLNDRYEQKTLTFSGLSEIKGENRIGAAAALNMPLTKLYGMSAAGFNSGEDDLENYNQMIESEIRSENEEHVVTLYKIGFMVCHGYIPSFEINWPSLRILNEVDQENVLTSKTNRILGWYDRGIVKAEKVVEWAKKEGVISIEIEEGSIPDQPVPPNGQQAITPPENKMIEVKRASKNNEVSILRNELQKSKQEVKRLSIFNFINRKRG